MGFKNLYLPSSEYLKIFAVGSITATTADNKYFGLTGGRVINIHIVNICSSLSIGAGVNFDKYDNLVQEIMQAILAKENADFVADTLLPMIVGSSYKQPPLVQV